jgi:hypothetical protein
MTKKEAKNNLVQVTFSSTDGLESLVRRVYYKKRKDWYLEPLINGYECENNLSNRLEAII